MESGKRPSNGGEHAEEEDEAETPWWMQK